MRSKLNKIKQTALNNKKVIENYFFMTVLQIINSFFAILIYPFVIKALGAECYGLYVFTTSIVLYFSTFIGFGFDMPAVKAISLNKESKEVKQHVLSCVFTAKIYLTVIATAIYASIVYFIPYLNENYILFLVCYLNISITIFFPIWYFQGIQKMRIVTYIQLAFKLLSLPFIFYFIKSSNDLILFSLISIIPNVLGSLVATFVIYSNDKIAYQWKAYSEIKPIFTDSIPFFLSTASNTFKFKSIEIILGSFCGMREVAIYDLANKIYTIPSLISANINGALFPKVINIVNKELVNRILKFEILLCFGVIATIILLGRYAIIMLGGEEMLEAYPLAVLLSFCIFTYLIVGSYINFVLVPSGKYHLVLRNQLMATFNFFILAFIFFQFSQSAYSLVLAMVCSALFEIGYIKYLVKTHIQL